MTKLSGDMRQDKSWGPKCLVSLQHWCGSRSTFSCKLSVRVMVRLLTKIACSRHIIFRKREVEVSTVHSAHKASIYLQIPRPFTMLVESIVYNNGGVSHMAQGDFSAALRCLSSSLMRVQEEAVSLQGRTTEGRGSTFELQTFPILGNDGCGVVSTRTDTSRFLYLNALLIVPVNSNQNSESSKAGWGVGPLPDSDSLTACSACIMFNLALLYLSQAITVDSERGEKRQSLSNVRKAQELYRLVLAVIHQRDDADTTTASTLSKSHDPPSSSSSMMRQTWLRLIEIAATSNLGVLQDMDGGRFTKQHVGQTFSTLLCLLRTARLSNDVCDNFFLKEVSNIVWKGMTSNCYCTLLEVSPPTDDSRDEMECSSQADHCHGHTSGAA